MSQFQLTWQPFNTRPRHFLRFPLCLPAVRMCVSSTNLEIELMQLNLVWTSCTCEWPHVSQDVVNKAVCSVGGGGGLGWLPICERHWLHSIFHFFVCFRLFSVSELVLSNCCFDCVLCTMEWMCSCWCSWQAARREGFPVSAAAVWLRTLKVFLFWSVACRCLLWGLSPTAEITRGNTIEWRVIAQQKEKESGWETETDRLRGWR